MPVFDVKKEPNISYHNLLLILYFGFVVFIFIFFSFFFCLFMCVFVSTTEAKILVLMIWVNWIKPFFCILMDKQITPPVFKTKDVNSLSLSLSMRKIHTNKKYLFFVSFQ